MKTLINIFLIFLFISCSNYTEKYNCVKSTITILNKQKYTCTRGGGWCSFNMYLYNGVYAEWYSTDQKTYESYNINDTLPTLVLTITKIENK